MSALSVSLSLSLFISPPVYLSLLLSLYLFLSVFYLLIRNSLVLRGGSFLVVQWLLNRRYVFVVVLNVVIICLMLSVWFYPRVILLCTAATKKLLKVRKKYLAQWNPFNVIMVNAICRLWWSYCSVHVCSRLLYKIMGYYNNLVNGVRFSLF